MSLTRELDLRDFDAAYAHAGLARAHASSGNTRMAKEQVQLAAEAGEAIAGEEDKEILIGDGLAGWVLPRGLCPRAHMTTNGRIHGSPIP